MLKSFFKFLNERKWVKNNPVFVVKARPTQRVGIKERLTVDEVRALEQVVVEGTNIATALEKQAYDRNKERDTAIMLIFLYSGIRVSELAGLDIKDVNIANSTLSLVRKSGKLDKIPFPDVIADYLNSYIEKRKLMA